MKIGKFLCLLLLIVVCENGYSQPDIASVNLSELMDSNRCVVHTAKTLYVAGEVLWYKSYLPKTLEYRESLIKVDLIRKSGSLAYSTFVKVNEDITINGLVPLPVEMETDIYYLCLTAIKELGNEPVVLAYHPITLINDLDLDLNSIRYEEDSQNLGNSNQHIPNSPIDVRIVTNPETARGKIKVSVGTDILSSESVSVGVISKKMRFMNDMKNVTIGEPVTNSFLVDNDIALTGQIFDASGQPGECDFCALIIEEVGFLRMFESNRSGRFEIDVPYFLGSKKVSFADFENESFNFQVNTSFNLPARLKNATIKYTPDMISYVQSGQARKKISQLFMLNEFNEVERENGQVNLFQPDKSFDLTNYPAFENMADFCRQFTTPLKIKMKRKGEIEIKMVNPDKKPFFPGIPRFMVDGHFVNDPEKVVQMDMNLIRKIDLFYYPKTLNRQFDLFGTNGVAIIYTKKGDGGNVVNVMENNLVLDGGIVASPFEELVPDKAKDPSIPVFRPVIYWNGDLKVDSEGEAVIEFTHTDDLGEFMVEVVGNGYGSATYTVK